MTFASKQPALDCYYYFTQPSPNTRLQVLETERSCEHHALINLTFTMSYLASFGDTIAQLYANLVIKGCDRAREDLRDGVG